jgi:hypothetical protein
MQPPSAFDDEGFFKLTGNAAPRVPPLFFAGGTSGQNRRRLGAVAMERRCS